MPVANLIRKATMTPAQRKAIQIASKPKRKRDKDNQWLPTRLEIQEGAAWMALLRVPDDPDAQRVHRNAWNALSAEQGRDFGATRCERCGTFRYGRTHAQACGHCGHVNIKTLVTTLLPEALKNRIKMEQESAGSKEAEYAAD